MTEAKETNGDVGGYIAHYEIEYNKKSAEEMGEDAVINFNSLLMFTYDVEEAVIKASILDYSEIETTHHINLVDATTDEVLESYSVKDLDNELVETVEVAQTNKQMAVDEYEAEDEIGTQQMTRCWHCNEYETGGGDLRGMCSAIINMACAGVNMNAFGRVVCAGGSIISCYVPAYSVCVGGQLLDPCPGIN